MVYNLLVFLQLVDVVVLVDLRLPEIFSPGGLLRLVLPGHVVELHIQVLKERMNHILLVLVFLLVQLILFLLLNLNLVVSLGGLIEPHLVQRIVLSQLHCVVIFF